ncbi:MAG TPA: OsmC family protein [Bacteroidales bacterium]
MKYTAKVTWRKRATENFIDLRYSRVHEWSFDGGSVISASSSPHVVPLPMSDASLVDPEESFIASLSSCHMLFFLSIAAKRKFVVESYEDNAEGIMGKNSEGKTAMLSVVLNPKIIFSGTNIPSVEEIEQIHELSHEECFIASSVKTKIEINLNG